MKNILFIVNPVAGGGKAKSLITEINRLMDDHKSRYEIVSTKKPKEATIIAKNNAKKYDVIVAVGGDGTINEVAKGIVSAGQGTLGIIPGGTGNDMARSLGIPRDLAKSINIVNKGRKKDIDIGLVNEARFLNIASVGFDAEVIKNHNRFKTRIKGGKVYILSVLYTLFNFKDKYLEIEIDGERIEEEILLLAVGNGKFYGGGMNILPGAKIDDGYLHICIISGIKRMKTLFLFPTIFRGSHTKYKKYVRLYRAKEVSIKSNSKIPINVDGEILSYEKDIRFRINNKALSVMCNKE